MEEQAISTKSLMILIICMLHFTAICMTHLNLSLHRFLEPPAYPLTAPIYQRFLSNSPEQINQNNKHK